MMVRLLALLVLAVRLALHQRRPGGDPPSGRKKPGDSDPPPPAEAVKPAQGTTRDRLTRGQPASARGQRPGEGEEGNPPDSDDPDSTDANNDGQEGDFTTPQPVGEPKKRKDSWLKNNGVDPHEVKKGLPGPISHFDLYVDRAGNIWAVRKGADPHSGEYIGNVDHYRE